MAQEPGVNWFESLTGFPEASYAETRGRLRIVEGMLFSDSTRRSYATGTLEIPSLRELRARAAAVAPLPRGKVRISCVSSDVRQLHRDAANQHAVFQVASQFNLLEMTGPDITPEHGVTRYEADPTQGPACAIAAGAATIYRNYFADLHGHAGQTRAHQIDCLADLGARLGNEAGQLWQMRNGYALCSEQGLATITGILRNASPAELDELRDSLRIGLHWDVEVTDAPTPYPIVSQAFCSALPVAYTAIDPAHWQPFATLVLEGAYEATLCAAAINAERHPRAPLFLTALGGGAFGNDRKWILHAMRRALEKVRTTPLDVRVVTRGTPDEDLERLVRDFA